MSSMTSQSSNVHQNDMNESTSSSKTLFENSLPMTPSSLTPSLSPLSQSELQVRSSSFSVFNSNDHYHLNNTQYSSDPNELSHYHHNKFGGIFYLSTQKHHRRPIVLKNGEINMRKERVEKRSQNCIQETFIAMVDLPWRYSLLVFALSLFGSWLLFAIIWYIVAYFHGDLGFDVCHKRCVIGVNSFSSAFLFSLESQLAICFGNRYLHESCVLGILIVYFQSILGGIIECFVVAFVLVKLNLINRTPIDWTFKQ